MLAKSLFEFNKIKALWFRSWPKKARQEFASSPPLTTRSQ
jgi:hypothetical protein